MLKNIHPDTHPMTQLCQAVLALQVGAAPRESERKEEGKAAPSKSRVGSLLVLARDDGEVWGRCRELPASAASSGLGCISQRSGRQATCPCTLWPPLGMQVDSKFARAYREGIHKSK